MKSLVSAAVAALALGATGLAHAEPVKVGMITTLSGGGAGLGIDARDGFMLALKLAGSRDLVIASQLQRQHEAVARVDAEAGAAARQRGDHADLDRLGMGQARRAQRQCGNRRGNQRFHLRPLPLIDMAERG